MTAEDKDYRDAESGHYVSEDYALAHPDTTVKETHNLDIELALDEIHELATKALQGGDSLALVPALQRIVELSNGKRE